MILMLTVLAAAMSVVQGVAMVSAGWYHSCTIDNAAKLYCFGDGSYGGLGHGGYSNKKVPTLVAAPLLGVRVLTVCAISYHTCAVTEVDGKLYCFGRGNTGRLGHGSTDNKLVPTLVAAPLSGVRVSAVSAGYEHTCAITEVDAELYCFGDGGYGQLGHGGTDDKLVPTLVAAPLLGVRVSAVSAGHSHTCAITEVDAKLYCFGHGTEGRLGHGGGGGKLVPTLVAAPLLGIRVSAVNAGSYHTCAITEIKAELYCFGFGSSGQLGYSGTDNKLVPILVAAPLLGVRVSAVSAGHQHTCAIAGNDSADTYCFGYGSRGRLGVGGTDKMLVPTLVSAPLLGVNVLDVSAGQEHTCALADEPRSLYCFGKDRLTTFGAVPVQVEIPNAATDPPTTAVVQQTTTAAVAQQTTTTAVAQQTTTAAVAQQTTTTAVAQQTTTAAVDQQTTTTAAAQQATTTAPPAEQSSVAPTDVTVPTSAARSSESPATGAATSSSLSSMAPFESMDEQSLAAWQLPVFIAAPLVLLVVVGACIVVLVAHRRRRGRRMHRSPASGDKAHRRAARASVGSPSSRSARSRGTSRSASMKTLPTTAHHSKSAAHYQQVPATTSQQQSSPYAKGDLGVWQAAEAGDHGAGAGGGRSGQYARGDMLLMQQQQQQQQSASPYAKGDLGWPSAEAGGAAVYARFGDMQAPSSQYAKGDIAAAAEAETSQYARGDIAFSEE